MPRRVSTATIARRYAALARMSSMGRAAAAASSAARLDACGRVICGQRDLRLGRAQRGRADCAEGDADTIGDWLDGDWRLADPKSLIPNPQSAHTATLTVEISPSFVRPSFLNVPRALAGVGGRCSAVRNSPGRRAGRAGADEKLGDGEAPGGHLGRRSRPPHPDSRARARCRPRGRRCSSCRRWWRGCGAGTRRPHSHAWASRS